MISRFPGQHGVALLAALILMLALVLTLGNVFYRHQLDVARATKSVHRQQALLLAMSAETWAAGLLATDRDERAIDTLEETWAQAVPLLPVEDGFIRGCMIDLQGRLNVGGFAAYDEERWAAETEDEPPAGGLVRSWLALLTLLELPADVSRAAAMIDWVDADTVAINQWGAEQSDYDGARASRLVPNSPLTDIEELAVVRGFDAAMVRTLRPWITALPGPTPVNVNTAPPQVLTAIGGGYSSFADFVMEQRPFFSLDNFRERLAETFDLQPARVQSVWPAQLVSVNSDYFRLQMEVSLGDIRLRIDSVLSRRDRDQAAVIRRDVAVVPALLPEPGREDEQPAMCESAEPET